MDHVVAAEKTPPLENPAALATRKFICPVGKPSPRLYGPSKYHVPMPGAESVEFVFGSANGSKFAKVLIPMLNPPAAVELDSPVPILKMLAISEAESATTCAEFQSLGRTRSDAAIVVDTPAELPTVTVPFQSPTIFDFAWVTGIRVPTF